VVYSSLKANIISAKEIVQVRRHIKMRTNANVEFIFRF